MLVLSRPRGEKLMIGEKSLTILEISGNQIRIGMAAPKEVSVHQEEIYRRLQEKSEQQKDSNA